MKRLLRLDWDIIAGIGAAVLAIIFHLLHIVQVESLFTIVLVLLALLLIRDLRREAHDEQLGESVKEIQDSTRQIGLSLQVPDVTLIGPRHLRDASRQFVESARGEMTWFNICFLMFQSQELFDLLLKPAIENPQITSIQFVSDEGERKLWDENMLPKIRATGFSDKVEQPRWRKLPQTVSFILSESQTSEKTEALLSFWGEPFMAKTVAKQLPRYVFHVHGHSELVAQFVEMDRQFRLVGE